jgi:hypothetical protein
MLQPTVIDLYEHIGKDVANAFSVGPSSKLWMPSVPDHFQFLHLMEKYDNYAAQQFTVVKGGSDPETNDAIWHYQMDIGIHSPTFTRSSNRISS